MITLTIFFLFQKKFGEILYTYISFLIFQVPFGIYKNLFWKQTNIGFESQFNELLYVDPYTPSKGFETFHGFLIRFYDNSQLYLSKHFFQILGFLDIHSSSKSLALTVIVYLFFFIAFIFAFWKKNKVMQLLSLYLAISIGATFVMLQTFWDQERMIILYFPLILILIGYGTY